MLALCDMELHSVPLRSGFCLLLTEACLSRELTKMFDPTQLWLFGRRNSQLLTVVYWEFPESALTPQLSLWTLPYYLSVQPSSGSAWCTTQLRRTLHPKGSGIEPWRSERVGCPETRTPAIILKATAQDVGQLTVIWLLRKQISLYLTKKKKSVLEKCCWWVGVLLWLSIKTAIHTVK